MHVSTFKTLYQTIITLCLLPLETSSSILAVILAYFFSHFLFFVFSLCLCFPEEIPKKIQLKRTFIATQNKLLSLLILHCGLSKIMPCIGTNLLKLCPSKTVATQSTLHPDHNRRWLCIEWTSDTEPMVYFGKAWLILRGCVGSQNNKYWSTEYPLAVHEVPSHDFKLSVWYAVSVWKIIAPVCVFPLPSPHRTVNYKCNIDLSPFQLPE